MIKFNTFHDNLKNTEKSVIQLMKHAHRLKAKNEKVQFFNRNHEEVMVMTSEGAEEIVPSILQMFHPSQGIQLTFSYSVSLANGLNHEMEIMVLPWVDQMIVGDQQEAVSISAVHLFEYVAAMHPGARFVDPDSAPDQ